MSATNEQIVAEAERRWAREPRDGFVTYYIIQVVREGWTPPPPVDPDLLVVREIVAKVFDEKGWLDHAGEARKGQSDKGTTIRAALDAYKAGKEAAQ